jgi:hypothetical protein
VKTPDISPEDAGLYPIRQGIVTGMAGDYTLEVAG